MTPAAYAKRIENLKNLAAKLAFSPAQQMPPMDPAMAGGAPMPPMDPAMMGGQQPMDPAAMGGVPMDPAMMGAPMDPAMMGGQVPMDPSAMAAQPPTDPNMTGDPAMMQQDPTMIELLDMVHAIGFMLKKVCDKLDISIASEDKKQQAEEAMLQEDQQNALDAQQAADTANNQVLSDQAQEAINTQNPGYLQDTLNQFNQAE